MMKAAAIVLIAASLSVNSSYGAQPKPPKQALTPTKPTPEQINQLVTRLDGLAKIAMNCRRIYSADLEVSKSKFRANMSMAQAENISKYGSQAELTALDRAKVQLKSLEELKANAQFPKCQQDAKDDALKQHVEEIASLPNAIHPVAKSAMAQWLTLIDAVPSDTFEEEMSKYRLTVNTVRIEAL
jgi:hypothetical protein